ncbi:AAA ATPase family protein [Spiroplasma clarkii]|nr:AAA ATPase family protein [Spiroplasma clarkii]
MFNQISEVLQENNMRKESIYIKDLLGHIAYAKVLKEADEIDTTKFQFLKSELLSEELPKQRLGRLVEIINNDHVVYKFNGLKIFIYGKPGTGKTSLVQTLAAATKKHLYSVSASNIISSRLGETQKNIDKLFEEIKEAHYGSIILVDEFDSLLGSRDREINDEYYRMIGTFNKNLDKLPKGSIVIAISNKPSFIDDSTLRRFNLKIEMNEISLDDLVKTFVCRAKDFNFEVDENLINKIAQLKYDDLNYSLVENVISIALLEEKSIEGAFAKFLNLSLDDLKNKKFTLREIEKVSGISRSTLQRKRKDGE